MSGHEYDWICIGSGASGLASAASAAEQGAATLVLEKAPVLGGATAYSYGSLWAGCNHVQRAAGLDDSLDDTLAYLRYLAGGLADEGRLLRFATEAPRVIEHFAGLGVQFQEVGGLPDHYYPIAPGSRPHGRTLEVQPLTRDTLGAWAERLEASPHMPEGLTWTEVVAWGGFGNRYEWDPAMLADRQRRYFAAGQGLVAWLLRTALVQGVEVRAGTPVRRLMVEDGRVVGVAVDADGGPEMLRARRGVVLATGSYEGNPMLVQALEEFGDSPNHFPPGITGDGLIMGAEIGALVRKIGLRLSVMLGYWVPPADGLGEPHFQSAGINELAYPHSMVVNRQGQRFGNESFFQALVPRLREFDVASHTFINRPCYLIFDSQFARRYAFAGRPAGGALPAWVPCADTPRALAERLGVAPAALEETLHAFNAGAREGVDPQFGRGESGWVRRQAGDAASARNPNLGTVEEPPFYGVELVPSGTAAGGLTADEHGRVIHVRGEPIPGLYGAGNVCAVTEYGVGYQAGLSLASGMTFGYLAAVHALGVGATTTTR
jgi:3-oxosteroid 1-dehydrogenase